MKRMKDRTNQSANGQVASVQSFAGSILNKYKAGAAQSSRFSRMALSFVQPAQPTIIQQTLRVQVTAPKESNVKASSRPRPAKLPERRIERLIEREKVTIERKTIVLRDVVHVIREQRSAREAAVTQQVTIQETRKSSKQQTSAGTADKDRRSTALEKGSGSRGSQRSTSESKTNERTENDRHAGESQFVERKRTESKIVESNAPEGRAAKSTTPRETAKARTMESQTSHTVTQKLNETKELPVSHHQKRIIPQAALERTLQDRAIQRADYYKWLQAKLHHPVIIHSLRTPEGFGRSIPGERIQLISSAGLGRASRKPLVLTNARRSAPSVEGNEHTGSETMQRQRPLGAKQSGSRPETMQEQSTSVHSKASGNQTRSDSQAGLPATKQAKNEQNRAKPQLSPANSQASEAIRDAEPVRQQTESEKKLAESEGKQAESGKKQAMSEKQQAESENKQEKSEKQQAESEGKQPALQAAPVQARGYKSKELPRLQHRLMQEEGSIDQPVRPAAEPPFAPITRVSGDINSNQARRADQEPVQSASSIFKQTERMKWIDQLSERQRERLQVAILQRKPQTTVFQAAAVPGSQASVISAKRLIHREQLAQSDQPDEQQLHASGKAKAAGLQGNTAKGRQQAMAEQQSQLVRMELRPTEISTGSIGSGTEKKRLPEAGEQDNRHSTAAGSSSTMGASSQMTEVHGIEAVNKGREGSPNIKAIIWSRNNLNLRQMTTVLQRFELRQARYGAGARAAHIGMAGSERGTERPGEQQTAKPAASARTIRSGYSETSRRKALLYRQVSTADVRGEMQRQPSGVTPAARERQGAEDVNGGLPGVSRARTVQTVSPEALLTSGSERFAASASASSAGRAAATPLIHTRHAHEGDANQEASAKPAGQMAVRAPSENDAEGSLPMRAARARLYTGGRLHSNAPMSSLGTQLTYKQLQLKTGAKVTAAVNKSRAAQRKTVAQVFVQRAGAWLPLRAGSPMTEGAARQPELTAVNAIRQADMQTDGTVSSSITRLGNKPAPLTAKTAAVPKKYEFLSIQKKAAEKQPIGAGVSTVSHGNPLTKASGTMINRSESTVPAGADRQTSDTYTERRQALPALSHHRPKPASAPEPPKQVQVDAPRELNPEQLEKMIMQLPQLHPEVIADRVYKALERKMKLEQRRRGF